MNAYEYLGARWAIEEGPVSYVLDPLGSDDISDGSDLVAIDRAFHKWSCVEKSGLRLLNSNNNGPREINLEDQINTIFFSETEDEARSNGMGPATLGITVGDVPLDTQSNIKRRNADITFNGFDHKWSVNGTETDIESIALHEIGHFIGFDHPCEGPSDTNCLSPQESVLSPSYSGGLIQNLGFDDIDAVKDIYEIDSEATCEGPYGINEPCLNNCECIDALYCVPSFEVARCLQPCSSENTSCPENFVCVLDVPDLTNGQSSGICQKKQIDKKLEPGAVCEIGRECASGNCLFHTSVNRSICIKNCNVSKQASCDENQFCHDGICLNKNKEEGIPCVNSDDEQRCYCRSVPNRKPQWMSYLLLLFFFFRLRNRIQ